MTVYLSPFETARLFTAIKLTFDSRNGFSIHKYGLNIKNFTEQSFEKKKDKHFFVRASKKVSADDMPMFLLANVLENSKAWGGDLTSPAAVEIFKAYQGRIESLAYQFTKDVEKLDSWCIDKVGFPDDLFKGVDPPLLRMHYQKQILAETLIIIDRIHDNNVFMNWSKQIQENIQWPKTVVYLEAYAPFLEVDLERFRKIFNTGLQIQP